VASPQKENGYTAIANEILDAVALLKVNGTQFKAIIAVWRNTYGFHRKDHEMSLAYIAKAIGVDKMQARRAIDGLIKMNVLVENAKPTFKSGRVISFNKDHETWLSTNEPTVDQLHYTTVDQLHYTTVDQLHYTTVDQSDYQQRKIKDNSKDNISKKSKIDLKQYDLSQGVVDVLAEFIEHRKQMKKPTTQLAITKIVNMFVNNKYNDDEMILALEKSIMNGYRGVFPLKDNERVYKEVEKTREPEPQFESEEQRQAQKEFVANLLKSHKPAIDLERMLE
jgi:phage replication O-like protein O